MIFRWWLLIMEMYSLYPYLPGWRLFKMWQPKKRQAKQTSSRVHAWRKAPVMQNLTPFRNIRKQCALAYPVSSMQQLRFITDNISLPILTTSTGLSSSSLRHYSLIDRWWWERRHRMFTPSHISFIYVGGPCISLSTSLFDTISIYLSRRPPLRITRINVFLIKQICCHRRVLVEWSTILLLDLCIAFCPDWHWTMCHKLSPHSRFISSSTTRDYINAATVHFCVANSALAERRSWVILCLMIVRQSTKHLSNDVCDNMSFSFIHHKNQCRHLKYCSSHNSCLVGWWKESWNDSQHRHTYKISFLYKLAQPTSNWHLVQLTEIETRKK